MKELGKDMVLNIFWDLTKDFEVVVLLESHVFVYGPLVFKVAFYSAL
jgi:hypothetical protein